MAPRHPSAPAPLPTLSTVKGPSHRGHSLSMSAGVEQLLGPQPHPVTPCRSEQPPHLICCIRRASCVVGLAGGAVVVWLNEREAGMRPAVDEERRQFVAKRRLGRDILDCELGEHEATVPVVLAEARSVSLMTPPARSTLALVCS